jgi:hypothetical protein
MMRAGVNQSGKGPPGANDTGKPKKMESVNAMSTEVLDNLIKQAEMLSPDEQLRLAAYLVERARQASSSPRRKWREMRGLARPSLFDEEAQTYITRTRREADEHRIPTEERFPEKPISRPALMRRLAASNLTVSYRHPGCWNA